MRGIALVFALAGCQLAFPVESPPLRCFGTVLDSNGGSPQPLCTTNVAPGGALPDSINTDTDRRCDGGFVSFCALFAEEIRILEPTTVFARGTKPLLLIAESQIEIRGTLDVASRVGQPPGAGGMFACQSGEPALTETNGDGGGGGGGGALGDGAAGSGGNAGADGTGGSPNTPFPDDESRLRGGCAGGIGAEGKGNPGSGGEGGVGGGAVLLVSNGTIEITETGIINASGAGGSGGLKRNAGSGGGGGGGGGAGGVIVFDAVSLTIAPGAKLLANGGGGGAGGSLTADGDAGGESTQPGTRATGGTTNIAGGAGGAGAVKTPANDLDGVPGAQGMAGGGGGGGGGGIGAIVSCGLAPATGSNVSPPLVSDPCDGGL